MRTRQDGQSIDPQPPQEETAPSPNLLPAGPMTRLVLPPTQLQ
jgi:hypothetical protein